MDLLPNLVEINQINNINNTFHECNMSEDFNSLSFEKQLEVINDLVRQTILTNPYPNPRTELQNLEGNCYTAAKVSIEYMKELGIGRNHKCVLVRRPSYEPEDITTKHVIVLVDDDEGNTYEYDASPYVGPMYGSVKKISTNNRTYDEYVEVDEEIEFLLNLLRTFIHDSKDQKIYKADIAIYEKLFNYCMEYPILNGYTAHCLFKLAELSDNEYDRNRYIQIAQSLNPYTISNPENYNRKIELYEQQIAIWEEELNELILSNTDYKRQLELAQSIVGKKLYYDPEANRFLNYKGQLHMVSSLTPRFFYENNLNVVMIKPSAYSLGVQATIRESFLKKGRGSIDSYKVDLSKPTQATGIHPMIFSHPLGEKYIRSMMGTSNILLLNRSAADLYTKKQELRNTLGTKIINKTVTWCDQKPILWDKRVTNLVHSTDNPSEACLHYSIGYPEYSVMNRFMYPNPKLEENAKVKKLGGHYGKVSDYRGGAYI